MFDDPGSLAQLMDYTIVRADATLDDLERACADAAEYGFAALIVNSCHVVRAKSALSGTAVNVGAVVGFPFGANTTTVKIFEAMEAIKNGVDELDIVINIGMVKSGRFDLVEIDIKNVIVLTKNVLHKVVIETGFLTPDEIRNTCAVVARSGAEFVKTCTGYGPRGVTVEDVRMLREAVGSRCRVKAAGGIRDLATLTAMIDAGAERVGTSAAVEIMKEYLGTAGRKDA